MFRSTSLRLALFCAALFALPLIGIGLITSSAASDDDQVINSLGETDYVRFISLPNNDIVFNAADSKLYTSVPSSAGSIGNSITQVDPYTASIGSSVFVGSEPSKLAMANDGQTLYTYLAGAFSIGRYNTASQTALGSFLIGYDSFYGFLVTSDLAVSPDDPNVVALARQSQTTSPSQQGVTIYNNGVRLPQAGPGHIEGSDLLTFSESGSTLYGSGGYHGLKRYSVTATGTTVAAQASVAHGHVLKYSNGKIFTSGGQVISAPSMSLLGTFPGVGGAPFVPDTAVGRVYYLTQDTPPNTWILRAFDVNTFTQIGSLTITNVSGTPTSLVRWGTNGLAFRTAGGQIFLIQTSLIPTPNPIPPPPPTPTITPTPSPTPYSAAIRQIQLPNNDLIYSASRQKFYATVPSTAGVGRGNSLTEIDPTTSALGVSTPVGSEPGQMAANGDGSMLFLGVNGAGGFRRFDPTTSTPGPIVSLTTPSGGFTTAFGIEHLPGSADSVAISRSSGGGIALYDGAVMRPTVGSGGQYIKFASPEVLFSNSNTITKHGVGPGGLSQLGTFGSGMSGEIDVKNGRIYASNGRVIDSNFTSVYGTYSGLQSSGNASVIDVENGRAFFFGNVNGAWVIRAYELNTFRLIGSMTLPDVASQTPRKLLRWGTNGLAFRTESRVYIIQSHLVDGGEPVPTPTPTPTVTPTPSPTPAATFVRRLNIPANDLVYNTQTNSVIAAVAGIAGAPLGNTMTHIDPATGQVLSSTFIGSEPKLIAASDDGQTLWTTLSGANAIRSYNLQTQTSGVQFTPPSNFQNVQDMAVMPGNPTALAIAARQSGVAIFDNGVQRPATTNGGAYAINSIEFSGTPNIFYGYDNESSGFELIRFTAAPGGVTGTFIAGNLISGFSTHIKHHNGVLYATSGRVVNPESVSVLGTYQGNGSTMTIDQAANRIYFLSGNVLSAFDLESFVKIGSVTISGFSGTPTSLARWGANGLVFRAPTSSFGTDSQIYLVQSALVSNSVPVPTGIALNSAVSTGFESQSNLTVTVTRTGETSSTASVDYTTFDGTAVAGQDYTGRNGNLVFAPGEVTKTVSIPIINDNIYEGTESFNFALLNATGPNVFLVSPSSAVLNISDNDQRPNVSSVSTSVLEPNLGRNAVANVQVQLTNPSFETITVNFNTSNATATAGADYVAANGLVTFAPFETVKSVPVAILPDLATEPNETFTVSLTNPTNTTISSGAATVTIRNLNHAAHVFDFDGDAKTDIGIFRPAGTASEWWINRSTNGSTLALQFGASTDRITPADYTGDGKADIAFFRPASGEWYILRSEDFSFFALPFGADGDVPVPADYDADGKADFAVFRPASSTWYISQSSGTPTQIVQFGINGDQPVPADYDGDGKADIGIVRPAASGAEWWIQRSTAGSLAIQFGASTDKPVQGDFTGDGKADIAIWRPSTGEWFIVRSEDSSFYGFPFGANGDVVAPGDYDGDGKFDATVFRPSNATWFISRTTAGTQIVQFGATGDRPVANSFVP